MPYSKAIQNQTISHAISGTITAMLAPYWVTPTPPPTIAPYQICPGFVTELARHNRRPERPGDAEPMV